MVRAVRREAISRFLLLVSLSRFRVFAILLLFGRFALSRSRDSPSVRSFRVFALSRFPFRLIAFSFSRFRDSPSV